VVPCRLRGSAKGSGELIESPEASFYVQLMLNQAEECQYVKPLRSFVHFALDMSAPCPAGLLHPVRQSPALSDSIQ